MSDRYPQTLIDPHTGVEYEVHEDDSQWDADSVRNGPLGGRGRPRPGRRPTRPGQGGPLAPRTTTITPVGRPSSGGHRPTSAQQSADHISIRKDDMVSLIGMGGELLAAFYGRPAMPQVVGDDVTDRTNAALHRDALALHDQNRDRIRALTGLAERAAKMMLS